MGLAEKPTDELRYVRRTILARLSDSGSPFYDKWIDVIVAVQRKWLVQTGDLYAPAYNGPPENPFDVFSHCDSIGQAWWFPMKEEWRDLESVTAEEAEKQAKI